MKTKIICLANSYKEGGRCIAGIQIDSNNIPIIIDSQPKWIRPIYNTKHGQIPYNLVQNVKLLDIVEFELTENIQQGYQSENVYFKDNSITIKSGISNFNLKDYCQNVPLIFGNNGNAVSQNDIINLSYSLLLVNITNFKVSTRTFPERINPQYRLAFTYNEINYNFPITDPIFIDVYKSNQKILDDKNEIQVVVSLGVVFNDWYYKLIAGVIL